MNTTSGWRAQYVLSSSENRDIPCFRVGKDEGDAQN